MDVASPDLDRFVRAQEGIYPEALAELKGGRKTTHWMWFVFPQLVGLGSSAMARLYAITSLEEARAYLTHPLLGARLRECARAAIGSDGRSASQMFGSPDDLKFRSSMTLFERADPECEIFADALHALCGGARDEATLIEVRSPLRAS